MIQRDLTVGTAAELLERTSELNALAGMLDAVRAGHGGQVVLVYGEAGIGKSALLREFRRQVGESATMVQGRCDELFTPRPLAAVVELARGLEGPLREALADGMTPHELALVLADSLPSPAVLVLEDLHLADEATLDVLRTLGTRAAEVPALVVATYRDDALDRWHPLRMVLGEVAAASRVRRLRLEPLSHQAVALMASAAGMLGEELYRKTGGNPFFVTEAIAAGDERIPETVRDAVLGRAARLSERGRRLLEVVAVARPGIELWLLAALSGNDIDSLGELVTSGMVLAEDETIAFRHELARLAIEEATSPHRRADLHRLALERLAASPDGSPDAARLAHHAAALGDGRLVLEFAPAAAEQASRLGAHRQAAAHYRSALRFADQAPLEVRARLFGRCAQELFLIVAFADAVAAQREALRCFEELGERRRQGQALSFLAQLLWQAGTLPEGLREGLAAAEQGVELLRGVPSRELVGALYQLASLQLAAEDPASALQIARQAQELAEELSDPWAELMALQIVGWAEYFTGSLSGREKLVRSLELAKQAGLDWNASVSYTVLVRTACRLRDYAFAEPYISEGLEYCTAGDYDVWHYYLLSWRANALLARGLWMEAAQTAEICLADPCVFARIHALVALGLVRARRGDPDAWKALDEAVVMAEPRGELQWIAPVAMARAETAWLEGRSEDAVRETELAYEFARGTWWEAGLAYWRWKAGAEGAVPALGEEQYRLEMAGKWADARDRWQSAGCRYEAAFALLGSDDPDALQRALVEFREMGANPGARLAMVRLRELGARGVPRGPRPRTRENPAGLTARELDVVALLADGLRNSEIAERLIVSEKTVDHHVSAILRKLDVHTRAEAAAIAARLGLAPAR